MSKTRTTNSPPGSKRELRSLATRERLLQATVASLYEQGYVATTTVEVCKRAKAPRGTMLHHFGTKTELVVAAAEHVFELRLREFRQAVADLPPARRTTPMIIDLLWSIIRGPTFYSWLELVVAARTDATLRAALHGMLQRFDAQATETFYELFPHARDAETTQRASKDFAFALLNGLAIDRILKTEQEITPTLELLKVISATFDPPAAT